MATKQDWINLRDISRFFFGLKKIMPRKYHKMIDEDWDRTYEENNPIRKMLKRDLLR